MYSILEFLSGTMSTAELAIKSALGVGNKVVGFKKANEPFVDYMLHNFAKASCNIYPTPPLEQDMVNFLSGV